MRSSGATLVRDAPPAMPPAINVAAQFVCLGGGTTPSSSSSSCSVSSLAPMSGSTAGAVRRRRSGSGFFEALIFLRAS